MKKINLLALSLTIMVVTVCYGCGGGGNSSDPNQGFKILTYARYQNSSQNPILPTGGRVQGLFLNGAGNYGSVTTFDRTHGGVGYLVIGSAKLPGNWRLSLGPGFDPTSQCLTTAVGETSISLGEEIKLYCPGRFFGFLAAPDYVDASNLSGTATFTGQGVDSTYGMPVLAYYDELGNMAASTTATQLNYNANSEIVGFEASSADLSNAYNGVHTVVIHNRKADGGLEPIGGSLLTVFGHEAPPPGGTPCDPNPPPGPAMACDVS